MGGQSYTIPSNANFIGAGAGNHTKEFCMRNIFKARIVPLFGIIALVVVIGFSMVGCELPKTEFPSEFRGTWERAFQPTYINTLTFSSDTLKASNQSTYWRLTDVSGNSYTIEYNDNRSYKAREVIKLVNGNLEISGDSGSGQDNWNGTWIRQNNNGGNGGGINGVWYHIDNSYNKTGSIITINGNVGTLTAIGENDIFKEYSDSGQMNIEDTVLRNISFQGEWDDLFGSGNIIYWDCEFIIPWVINSLSLPDLKWHETYISYNIEESYMFIYTMGDPNFGLGYRFRK